jgi:hypothetical protein
MMNWFSRIRTFFRQHDFEFGPYELAGPILLRHCVCKKCGKKTIYFPSLMMSPIMSSSFFFGCPGKKSDSDIGEEILQRILDGDCTVKK